MEIKMTSAAIAAALDLFKKEIAGQKDNEEKYVGIRVGVKGGGCGSSFSP